MKTKGTQNRDMEKQWKMDTKKMGGMSSRSVVLITLSRKQGEDLLLSKKITPGLSKPHRGGNLLLGFSTSQRKGLGQGSGPSGLPNWADTGNVG